MMSRKAPIRHFLHQELPPKLKAWHRRYVRDPIWWVRHRTVDRYNVVKLTSLKPSYHEIDTRMLHAMFDLLVEYVEIGLAYKNFQWWDENRPEVAKWMPKRLRERMRRKDNRANRIAAGMAHLEWEIAETTPPQSTTAAEVKELYLWWTVERPARTEPWGDPRIWAKVREDRADRSIFSMMSHPGQREAGDHATAADEFYYRQDQAMMQRLVEIRIGLWT